VVGVPVGGLGHDVEHHQRQSRGVDAAGHTVTDGTESDDADGRTVPRCWFLCWCHDHPLVLDKCLDYSLDT
jgi:hypothetical protein